MAAPRRRIWQTPAPRAAAATDSAGTLLEDLTHALVHAERAEEAFQFALDRTCPAVDAQLGSIFLREGASELMRLVAAYEWPDRWQPWLGEMRVRVGFGPSGEAVSERRVIEVPDVMADAGLEDWQEVATELGFRALVALPLSTADGVFGAATFYFAAPGVPSPKVRATLRAASDLMAAMAERSALRDRLRRAEAALDSIETVNTVNLPTVSGVEAPEENT